jgi:hypothetical protein
MKTIVAPDILPAASAPTSLDLHSETQFKLSMKTANLHSTTLDISQFDPFFQHQRHQPLVNTIKADDLGVHCSVRDLIHCKLHEHLNGPDVEEDAFFVGDIGEVLRQHRRWKKLLPRIEPYYAVKCNPDPLVLKTLVSLGIGFDWYDLEIGLIAYLISIIYLFDIQIVNLFD